MPDFQHLSRPAAQLSLFPVDSGSVVRHLRALLQDTDIEVSAENETLTARWVTRTGLHVRGEIAPYAGDPGFYTLRVLTFDCRHLGAGGESRVVGSEHAGPGVTLADAADILRGLHGPRAE